MSTKTQWIEDELKSLKDQGLYNTIRTLGSAQGAWLTVDGRRTLNFCSNNYLGLADDSRLKQAANDAIAQYGIGPAAVRTIAGTMTLHVELERRLAGAKIVRYRHCDPNHLRETIAAEKGTGFRRALIITDGVFSMDGDVAPLADIYAVAQEQDILLMVDDAHGEVVLGKGGRGIVDHFDLHGKVDVEIGTLSKAFGVVGGCVAGNETIVEWLRQRGRPFLFSSAMTVPDVAACLAALDILESSTELVDRLWDNARYFKSEMKRLGFDTGLSTTPITPIMLGEAPLAQQFSRRLFEEGVFAMAIGFPTVPKGKARIRVMISAAHSRDDLDQGLAGFAKVGKELGVVH